jgi:hypothetical protein
MRRPAHHAWVVIPLAIVAALAGACTFTPTSSGSPASSAGQSRPSQEAPSLKPAPTAPAPVTGEVPPTVLDAARAELAKRVGIDRAALATVLTAAAVDWPDGSLGCPQPGMVYPQVITPGYQVVFEVDGKEYDIRATTSGGVILCESGRPLGG